MTDCVGPPPVSVDAFFSIIDRCATSYGGDNWEMRAMAGIPAFLMIALTMVIIYLMLRAVSRGS